MYCRKFRVELDEFTCFYLVGHCLSHDITNTDSVLRQIGHGGAVLSMGDRFEVAQPGLQQCFAHDPFHRGAGDGSNQGQFLLSICRPGTGEGMERTEVQTDLDSADDIDRPIDIERPQRDVCEISSSAPDGMHHIGRKIELQKFDLDSGKVLLKFGEYRSKETLGDVFIGSQFRRENRLHVGPT